MGTIVESVRNTMLDDSFQDTPWVSLYVGDPQGAGTETSGTGYQRYQITLTAASGAVRSNNAQIVFTVGSGGWDSGVNYAGLHSASTGGTLLASDQLDATRDMSVVGATMTFGIGDIDVSLT